MEKRIKIFVGEEPTDLEKEINEFLSKQSGKLHDIKFIYTDVYCQDNYELIETFSALLIYTPLEDYEKDKNSEENEESDGGIQGRYTPFGKQGRPCC